jgi:hypothetical protein
VKERFEFLVVFYIVLINLLCWFCKNAGGGAKGKEARMGGNMASAMAEAQGFFLHFMC